MIAGALRAAGFALLLALALPPASAGASATRPPGAQTPYPAHLEHAGSGRSTVRVTNAGTSRVVVDVRRAGFALDLRGRPRIVGREAVRRSAAPWLAFSPRSLALAPGSTGTLTVVSRVPARAEPGDHDALVLLTTRRRVRGGLAVRVRMGVVVVVRAPGKVVRRLALGALRPVRTRRGRALELVLANRGNVTETLARGRAVVFVERAGRRLARLVSEPRVLRPGTRGVLRFPIPRRLVGSVVARVDVVSETRRTQRVYRLRL
jgi:hypothetical protein